MVTESKHNDGKKYNFVVLYKLEGEVEWKESK